MVAAGLRVIRGPGWSHGDADDGEGHVGTVVDASDDGTAKVTWDGGQQVIVKPGSRDLRVLDNAPVGKVVIYMFFCSLFSFLVCEQLLKGIVYPLAIKAHNVLDLVHQKEFVTLSCM